mmetsp:Transcript_17638/g.37766  ORF Transcript_17638/g.37766 Transcript_17638/m.37766 type:complete len:352 (+) Transcript_17638:112-1167(+)
MHLASKTTAGIPTSRKLRRDSSLVTGAVPCTVSRMHRLLNLVHHKQGVFSRGEEAGERRHSQEKQTCYEKGRLARGESTTRHPGGSCCLIDASLQAREEGSAAFQRLGGDALSGVLHLLEALDDSSEHVAVNLSLENLCDFSLQLEKHGVEVVAEGLHIPRKIPQGVGDIPAGLGRIFTSRKLEQAEFVEVRWHAELFLQRDSSAGHALRGVLQLLQGSLDLLLVALAHIRLLAEDVAQHRELHLHCVTDSHSARHDLVDAILHLGRQDGSRRGVDGCDHGLDAVIHTVPGLLHKANIGQRLCDELAPAQGQVGGIEMEGPCQARGEALAQCVLVLSHVLGILVDLHLNLG